MGTPSGVPLNFPKMKLYIDTRPHEPFDKKTHDRFALVELPKAKGIMAITGLFFFGFKHCLDELTKNAIEATQNKLMDK